MDQSHQPKPIRQASLVGRTLSEWKTLALLGGPILVAQLALMANGVIDTIMAGHASAEDLSGVAIGTSLWVPLFLFFMGVLSALQPIISGYRGSNTLHRIMPITWQGLHIAAGAAVLIILFLVNVRPILDALQLETKTARITQGYLAAFAWGIPAILVFAALRGLTDGLGHTKVFMAFSLLGTGLNLPLNYILIYGKLGMPELGGIGCGWATAISNWVAVTGFIVYLNRSRHYSRFHLIDDWVKPHWADIKYVLQLGIPIGFTIFIEASVFSVIALFLAPLGPVVVAGHQIALNVVSLVFMVPLSLGMALTLRISFLLGAKATDAARLNARSSLVLGMTIAAAYATLFFLGSDLIARLYTSDSQVQAVAGLLLAYAAIFQIADVMQVTCISALRGYRDTRIPMYIMLLSFWAICLPLGYILTFTDWIVPAIGAAGFWIGLIAGLTSAATLLVIRLFWFSRQPLAKLDVPATV